MLKANGPRSLSHSERVDWLRLIRTENVGPITFRRLIEQFGGASAALAALPGLLRRGGRTVLSVPAIDEAERELERLSGIGGRTIALPEPEYPARLRALEDAPPVLFLLGGPAVFARPAVGIVGSRNASLNGRRLAEELAADLARAGLVIVSGLARGIDAAAHRGAVATGTIAVVAGGVDVVYPRENDQLAREIAGSGAVISEMPLGSPPQARHFPQRNRLISGLSLGVIVVEAHLHSGSLITARCALDQGREVFAVPGSPSDARAKGCNDLIRQAAVLVESAEDVLRGLALDSSPVAAVPSPSPASLISGVFAGDAGEGVAEPRPAGELEAGARERLAELLSPTPVGIDDIVRACHLPPAMVHTILLEWELAGRLERHPGNRVALVGSRSGE